MEEIHRKGPLGVSKGLPNYWGLFVGDRQRNRRNRCLALVLNFLGLLTGSIWYPFNPEFSLVCHELKSSQCINIPRITNTQRRGNESISSNCTSHFLNSLGKYFITELLFKTKRTPLRFHLIMSQTASCVRVQEGVH